MLGFFKKIVCFPTGTKKMSSTKFKTKSLFFIQCIFSKPFSMGAIKVQCVAFIYIYLILMCHFSKKQKTCYSLLLKKITCAKREKKNNLSQGKIPAPHPPPPPPISNGPSIESAGQMSRNRNCSVLTHPVLLRIAWKGIPKTQFESQWRCMFSFPVGGRPCKLLQNES